MNLGDGKDRKSLTCIQNREKEKMREEGGRFIEMGRKEERTCGQEMKR